MSDANSLQVKFPLSLSSFGDNNGQQPAISTIKFNCGKPVVIVGPNGAGKTRLSVLIESLNDLGFKNSLERATELEAKRAAENATEHADAKFFVHRISAQRSLSMSLQQTFSNEETLQKIFFYGSNLSLSKESARFSDHPTTGMLDDFNKLLALFFAKDYTELSQIRNGKELINISKKVIRIWNQLSLSRKLEHEGPNLYGVYKGEKYLANKMSDGERVIFYMICQALLQRPKTLFIVDEPEAHIHKSIVNKLWTLLEQERQDCVFMYITHELDFVFSRKNARIFWVKEFDGTSWDYDEVTNDSNFKDVPTNVLNPIVGNNKKILAVEGHNEGSLDYRLYPILHENEGYTVVPCGSNTTVTSLVQNKAYYSQQFGVELHGLVDLDDNDEEKVLELKEGGIDCLGVAAIENLFLLPDVIKAMAKILNKDPAKAIKRINFLIKQAAYNNPTSINKQISAAVKERCSFFLSKIETIENTNSEQFAQKLATQAKNIFEEKQKLFNQEKAKANLSPEEQEMPFSGEIEGILRWFKDKKLTKDIIEDVFQGDGFDFDAYVEKVLDLLQQKGSEHAEERKQVMDAMIRFIPTVTKNK